MRGLATLLCAACSGGSDGSVGSGFGIGEVLIQSLVNLNSASGMQSGWVAAFKPTDVCTRTLVGPCQVQSCSGIAPLDPNVHAGMLDILGPPQPVTLNPGGGKYEGSGGLTNSVAAETNLSVTASGAAVPAFHALVKMPSPVSLERPSCPISGGGDLTVRWTGGSRFVEVYFGRFGLEGAIFATATRCFFAAEDGQGVVPASALEQFVADGGTGMGVWSIDLALPEAGGFTVMVAASVQGDADGDTLANQCSVRF